MVEQRVFAAQPRKRMSYEEFLDWADEDTLAEWVDGEVVTVSPASRRHRELAGFLEKVIGLYVDQRSFWQVLSAPFQMKLEHGRKPDLLYIASEHLDRLRVTFLDGPADVVVEIVSPDSVGRDRREKFYEYEAGGVPEYWLIDPQREWGEFYQLEDDRYRLTFEGREGDYQSQVIPDFWLRAEWLWQEPLPAVLDVLLEVGGSAYAHRLVEQLRRHGFLPADDEA